MVANTIGAGVYTTSGFTLGDLGTPGAVLLAWVLAALLALSGALSFGALARALPLSGGEYLFLSRLWHPAAGFIAGWVSLVAGFAGAQAFGALTLVEYLPFSPVTEKSIAVALLLFVALSQGVLVRFGTAMQNLTVALKAFFLTGFILVGWLKLPPSLPVASATVNSPDWATWAYAVLMVSLSFTGFNAAIYVAEECQDPRRDVPRAMFWGTVITAVLYLSVNAVFLYSAPVDALRGVPGIALASAEALGGRGLAEAVRALVLLSLFTLISGTAVSGPRVVKKMGEDGFLPPLTLGQASAVQCAIAVVMTLWSDLVQQLGYLSLVLSLVSALTVATVFRLPPESRPHLFWPAIYLFGTAITSVAALSKNPSVGWGALVTLVSGLVAYRLVRRPDLSSPEGVS